MGFRVAWIARSGRSIEEMLRLTKRELTGERHEFPDVGWYLLELPGASGVSWTLLIADGSENFAELSAEFAQNVSQGGNRVIYFWCSDTVMATELFHFENGKETWSVQYDSEDESKQPRINGDPPPIVAEVLSDLKTKQSQSDANFIYDLTAELGREIVGFRHDTELNSEDASPFQVLSEPVKRQVPWWQFWKQ